MSTLSVNSSLRLRLKAVLSLQQNGQEGTEIPHVLPPLTFIVIINRVIHDTFFFSELKMSCIGTS